jgi:hypothetical protein
VSIAGLFPRSEGVNETHAAEISNRDRNRDQMTKKYHQTKNDALPQTAAKAKAAPTTTAITTSAAIAGPPMGKGLCVRLRVAHVNRQRGRE